MNLDELVALDIHTHTEEPCCSLRDDNYDESQTDMAEYVKNPTMQQTADYYRERNIGCVIFPVDAERETRFRRYDNEEVARSAADNSDIMIPFASINPAKGKDGAREARRLVREFGVRGFTFNPTLQGFAPNNRSAYPLYEAIAEESVVALFHTGHTVVGAGLHDGMGMRSKYSNPLYLDDVATDFPDMPIIMAHPSVPWREQAFAMATHKPNVYIDLSGWSPKYYSPMLVQYANTFLRNKILFGSDWPALTPDHWLSDFEKIPFHDDIRPLILKDNARRLLNL